MSLPNKADFFLTSKQDINPNPQRYPQDNNPIKPNQKLRLDRLMTPNSHRQNRSNPPTQCTKQKQIFFTDSPLHQNRLPLINSPQNEGSEIDEQKIYEKDDSQDGHGTKS